jgi:ABC-2 type transport system permease protein
MAKVALIAWREFRTRVRKRSFILLTLLAPLGMALIILLPLLLVNLEMEPQRILVLDGSISGQYPGTVMDAPAGEAPWSGHLRDTAGLHFDWAPPHWSLDSAESAYVRLGYDALLVVPASPSGAIPQPELLAPRQVSIATKYYIESALEQALEAEQYRRLGLDRESLRFKNDLELSTGITGQGRMRQEGSAFAATVVGYFMGFSIYVVLLIYGTMVMRGVMEEKTNRIVEVIVTSVRPFQLMLGKIFGIGAVGLAQFSVWALLGVVVQGLTAVLFADQLAEFRDLTQGGAQLQNAQELERLAKAYASFQHLPVVRLFAVFAFYFLGGYLLYSALFAAVGALSSDDGGDSQLYLFPVTLPIILSIVVMIIVIQQPNSALAFWASIIPLSSPIVMPARMPFIGVLNGEVALSMGLLVLGFLAATAMAGRIYRTGILLYGKKVSPRELWRWLWFKP